MWSILSAVLLLLVAVYLHYKHAYTHWQRKGIPHLKPRFPFGNFGNLIRLKKPIYSHFRDYYDAMKRLGYKHSGFYVSTLPVYMPITSEYIKNVLVRDFHHFANHGLYNNQRDDPLGAHLFTLEDEKWKDLRVKLTPTFTSSKIKQMFALVSDCSVSLLGEIAQNRTRFDIKDAMQKFMLDVIASCGFGVVSNAFDNPASDFVHYGKTAALDYVMRPKFYLLQFWPALSRKLRLRLIREDVSAFFMDLVRSTVEHRVSNGVERNDFLQVLLGLKARGLLTMEELAAQVYMFFFAGFDSTALALTYAVFELAQNPRVQRTARNEVLDVLERHRGELSYDAVQEMKYLQQVIDETLRKDSPVVFLFRKCCRSYKIPGTESVIDEGTMVLIPTYGLHYDEEYFPEPERFDPDRFSEGNRPTIPPFSYLPFGDGPRGCIGVRFAMMIMKVGLAQILSRYKVSLHADTEPVLRMKVFDIGYTNENDVFVDFEEIE